MRPAYIGFKNSQKFHCFLKICFDVFYSFVGICQRQVSGVSLPLPQIQIMRLPSDFRSVVGWKAHINEDYSSFPHCQSGSYIVWEIVYS